jgi:hypothetical protein
MKRATFRDYLRTHRRRWLFLRRPYGELYPRWQFWRGYRLDGFLPDIWYYLKCRLWHQYNVVRVDSLHPTWTDRSELLLYASFTILRHAVEREDWLNSRAYFIDGDEFLRWDGRDEWQEVATLYDWWVNVRPARIDPTEWWADTLKAHGMYTSMLEPDENYEVIEHADGGCTVRERDVPGNPDKKDYQNLILRMSSAMEQGYEDEDERMLKRLAEVRLYLWT